MEKQFKLIESGTNNIIEVTAKKVGKSWMALCPKHDDHTPSLSIDEEKGVFKCHSTNCNFKGRVLKEGIVAVYDHIDEIGNLSYQVLRYQPKSFAFRRPDSSGRWVYNIDGIKKIPYRLPELLQSSKDTVVYFVEGQKDVDTLTSFGFTATTLTPLGKEWDSSLNRYFEGRNIVLLPDNDGPGREYSYIIGSGLSGIANSIRWLELPGLVNKEDVSNWFDKSGTAKELIELTKSAKDFKDIQEEEELSEDITVIDDKKFNSRHFVKNILKARDIISDYLEYVSPTIDSPNIFHIISSIALISTLLGRKVYFNYGTQKIFMNIWAVVIARTTTFRKSTSIKIIRNSILQSFYPKYLMPDEFTQEALMEHLAHSSSSGLIIWSEFAAFLASAQKQYMAGIKEFLADIYDCPDFKERILKSKKYRVEYPYLTIIAA